MKYIILFTFFPILLYAQQLQRLLFEDCTDDTISTIDYVAFNSDYFDIYRFKESSQKRYIVLTNNNSITVNKHLNSFYISADYSYMHNLASYSDNSTNPNYIALKQTTNYFKTNIAYETSDKLLVGIGLSYSGKIGASAFLKSKFDFGIINFNSELKYNNLSIGYEIKNMQETIPLNSYILSNRLNFSNDNFTLWFGYNQYFEDNSTDNFSTNISGFAIPFIFLYRNNNLSISGSFNFSEISAKLKKNKIEYGYIDKLSSIYSDAKIDYKINNYDFGIGTMYYKVSAGDNTYIDAWPFNMYDVFLVTRIRINEFKNSVILPYVFSAYTLNGLSNADDKLNIRVVYNFTSYSNTNLYRERYPVMYPLLFAYRDKELNINNSVDAIVDLYLKYEYKFNYFNSKLELCQSIPLDYSKIKIKTRESATHSSSNNSQSVWGGTYIKFNLEVPI